MMLFVLIRHRSRLLISLILFILIVLFINEFLFSRPSRMSFHQLNSCPKCFGFNLCPAFVTDHFLLTGLHRFSLLNNDYFNIKNIYHGVDREGRRIVLKKLAHQSEWKQFDQCQTKNHSCLPSVSLTRLFPCATASNLNDEFRSVFLSSTGLSEEESEMAFQTALQVNVEPIILATLSGDDDRILPFPFYYGACGRVIVVSDEGTNLVNYLHSSFSFRAFLARELLISMHQLIIGHPEMIIFYPDINLENFVFNSEEKRVKIIDLEYLIISERLSSEAFCRQYRTDFNIEQVCRYLLSPSSTDSWNFLHDIPNEVETQWNLTMTLRRCAETSSTDERLKLYENLLQIFERIEKIQ